MPKSKTHFYSGVSIVVLSLLLGSCSSTETDNNSAETMIDTTPPVLTEVSKVVTPTNLSTPDYTFNSSEAGAITYGGDCASETMSAVIGDNTIVFNSLSGGFYDNCRITVTDNSGNSSDELSVNAFSVVLSLSMNDTGVVACGDYAYTDNNGDSNDVAGSGVHNNNLDCTTQPVVATQEADGSDLNADIIRAGQDAFYGRDVTDNDDSDGLAGFSYTKLDASGLALTDQTQDYTTQPWSCVRDNVTRLVWEVKTTTGMQDSDYDYTWYNSSGDDDGGDHGVGDTGAGTTTGYESSAGVFSGSDNCDDTARCDTEKYVVDVNTINAGAGLCGNNDWRLPTKHELLSLINSSQSSPAIDSNYFPNTNTNNYWSSSSYAANDNLAWQVGFGEGVLSAIDKHLSNAVRLVRDGE